MIGKVPPIVIDVFVTPGVAAAEPDVFVALSAMGTLIAVAVTIAAASRTGFLIGFLS